MDDFRSSITGHEEAAAETEDTLEWTSAYQRRAPDVLDLEASDDVHSADALSKALSSIDREIASLTRVLQTDDAIPRNYDRGISLSKQRTVLERRLHELRRRDLQQHQKRAQDALADAAARDTEHVHAIEQNIRGNIAACGARDMARMQAHHAKARGTDRVVGSTNASKSFETASTDAQKGSQPPVSAKPSGQYLSLRTQEAKLARAGRFEEAQVLAQEAAAVRKRDQRAHKRQVAAASRSKSRATEKTCARESNVLDARLKLRDNEADLALQRNTLVLQRRLRAARARLQRKQGIEKAHHDLADQRNAHGRVSAVRGLPAPAGAASTHSRRMHQLEVERRREEAQADAALQFRGHDFDTPLADTMQRTATGALELPPKYARQRERERAAAAEAAIAGATRRMVGASGRLRSRPRPAQTNMDSTSAKPGSRVFQVTDGSTDSGEQAWAAAVAKHAATSTKAASPHQRKPRQTQAKSKYLRQQTQSRQSQQLLPSRARSARSRGGMLPPLLL